MVDEEVLEAMWTHEYVAEKTRELKSEELDRALRNNQYVPGSRSAGASLGSSQPPAGRCAELVSGSSPGPRWRTPIIALPARGEMRIKVRMTTMIDTRVRPFTTNGATPARGCAVYADGLRREFPGGVVAVDGINLDVRDDEIFAALGPNGAGKTTTVRMLTTLLRPSAGQATVAGYDLEHQQLEIQTLDWRRLQEAGLDPMATGRELLELQAQLFGISGSRARERAAELLELVGLVDAADRQVKRRTPAG